MKIGKIQVMLQDNEIEKENFIQQHKLISSFDGLNRLMSFILKNESITSK